jgi:hypothetical protein
MNLFMLYITYRQNLKVSNVSLHCDLMLVSDIKFEHLPLLSDKILLVIVGIILCKMLQSIEINIIVHYPTVVTFHKFFPYQ